MRVRIEIDDLTEGQREWFQRHLPPPLGPGLKDVPRMCVQIDVSEGVTEHREMMPRQFVALISGLQNVGRAPMHDDGWRGDPYLGEKPSSDPIESHPAPCGYPSLIPCTCSPETLARFEGVPDDEHWNGPTGYPR